MLIGLLVPGGGHIYAGSLGSAVMAWLAIAIMVGFAFAAPFPFRIIAILTYFIIVWDAGQAAKRFNRRHFQPRDQATQFQIIQ